VLLLGTLWRGVRLVRSASLVLYGDPYQVVPVVQLADDVLAGAVHDRIGDQLGDDEGRRVDGVLAHRPVGQSGARQPPGSGDGARMGGQLEAETALGVRDGAEPWGGAETGAVFGGVCS